MSMAISGSSSMIRMSVATWREISLLAWASSSENSCVVDVENFGRLVFAEAFDGDQQEGLAGRGARSR